MNEIHIFALWSSLCTLPRPPFRGNHHWLMLVLQEKLWLFPTWSSRMSSHPFQYHSAACSTALSLLSWQTFLLFSSQSSLSNKLHLLLHLLSNLLFSLLLLPSTSTVWIFLIVGLYVIIIYSITTWLGYYFLLSLLFWQSLKDRDLPSPHPFSLGNEMFSLRVGIGMLRMLQEADQRRICKASKGGCSSCSHFETRLTLPVSHSSNKIIFSLLTSPD